ncbi:MULTISPECIES: cellulase family glycosylhydrolase [Pseudomonas fluorescens group]|uniref:cellulase family glycosylhydrolase n=1 Tax=Pseudomonas fluorescens group TaxID=136843 RepID=UPI00087B57DC|nr:MULTISPECIES: cellulase family glycosylhydrolase [Pseudomonas fluorescens group]SDU16124.1 Cellulase (glycosyl hydrolase family 5) [Pseudomonas moraviensis]
MKSAQRNKLAALVLMAIGATSQVHASELFPNLPAKTIGVQVKIQSFTAADAAQIKAAGFSFVRFGVWSDSLTAKAYQKQVSDAFAAAASAGLPVLLTVRAIKALPATSPAELNAAGATFANAVTGLEKSWSSQLVAIEIWNEPDLETYWPTRNFDTTFVPFMAGMCKAFEGQTQTTPRVGFGFARPPSAGSASTVALKSIVSDYPKCLNAVSYHPYGMTATQISNAQTFIQQNFNLPGVISEWGVSALASNGGPEGQATRINAFIADVKRLNIPLTSIYEWRNSDSGSNDREKNFGFLTSDGQPKPARLSVEGLLNAE